MAVIDDRKLAPDGKPVALERLEINRPTGRREVTHVIHDIDGTHSLIRDWPPVMSLCIHWAMTCGLEEDFDSKEALEKLVSRVGAEPLPETDEFCIISAGLSALTQMEYGIRRAVQLGNLPADIFRLSGRDAETNARIIEGIKKGRERFDDMEEQPELTAFIAERAPRLFRLYEKVLNAASRDRNTADARRNPEKWRVPGSLEFIRRLKELGCRNYFVTGSVISDEGGMKEEVEVLGFEIGAGRLVESLFGSSWDKKEPKDEVMRELFKQLGVSPDKVLVVGDGRTEIGAGVEFGAITISRLPADAEKLRQIHRGLGTNFILADYNAKSLSELIHA